MEIPNLLIFLSLSKRTKKSPKRAYPLHNHPQNCGTHLTLAQIPQLPVATCGTSICDYGTDSTYSYNITKIPIMASKSNSKRFRVSRYPAAIESLIAFELGGKNGYLYWLSVTGISAGVFIYQTIRKDNQQVTTEIITTYL